MRTVALLPLLVALSIAGEPARVYTVDDGATAPRVIEKSAPEYTEQARLARLTGTVVVKLIVDEDATLRDVYVSRPLGMGLDEKAVEAVKSWQFAPGTVEGRPVAVLTSVEVNFQLLAARSDWRMTRVTFDGPAVGLVTADYPAASGPEEYADVVVSFDIDEQGVPQNLHVERSTAAKWEPEVVTMLGHWRFKPGKRSRCTLAFARGKSGT